jgi:serine/threonine protein kinase
MEERRSAGADGDVPGELELASGKVRNARPVTDGVAMDAVRARVEQSLFGAASHTRLGRYVIVERIAGGGMGVVYRADDPELHRKVALKVLHPRQLGDARARQRMLGEARALARLDHPNVVKIHDVLTIDDQIVIVMALIEGATLASWEAAAPRSWRELVRAYAQAGDGLAAAHALDIIHRDFKPANAIIGDDSQVRVLDFGLARLADTGDPGPALGSPDPAEAPGSPGAADAPDAISTAIGRSSSPTVLADGSSSATVADGSSDLTRPDGFSGPTLGGPGGPIIRGPGGLTATGEVVGTLGYISPEQLAGQPATHASDQFSFCVALHRAVEGVPPFTGADVASRLRSIRAGVIQRATDRRIPGWLRAVLARGLSSDPAVRFPSMAALLAELRRPRGWRRWRVPAAGATVAGAFVIVVASRPSPAALDAPCDGGVREIGAVWSAARHAQLAASLGAVDAPDLRPMQDRVLDRLDAYRDHWVELHRDACTSHRRGAQSAALLDRRMACLTRRLGELRIAVDVLGRTDRATAVNVLDVTAHLPELDACADTERLQADAPPPETAAQRPRADDIRTRLSRAAVLDRAGRSEDARDLARATVVDAEQLGYAPLVAEAHLALGKVLLGRRDEATTATASLARARAIGLEQRMFPLAIEAGARQIYVEAMQDGRATDLLRDAALLEPISRSLAGDHFARPLLLNNIGSVHMADGDRAAARESYEAAHAALQGVTSPDVELTCIDKNRAMLNPDPAQRRPLARSVWERRRDALGDHHLFTLEALDAYARYEPDPTAAYELITATCTGYDAHPELLKQRMTCHAYQAFLAEYRGDRESAHSMYRDVTRLAKASDAANAFWGQLATGHDQRLERDATGAIDTFSAIFQSYRNSRDWWVRYRAADALLGWGLAERDRGESAAAARLLGDAAAMFDEIAQLNEEIEFRFRGDLARRMLRTLATP